MWQKKIKILTGDQDQNNTIMSIHVYMCVCVNIYVCISTHTLIYVCVYIYRYICASLVAQSLKNPSAMQETWVLSLCWEDPLEKDIATHSSILAGESPWTIAHKAPLFTEFSQQEYWSGLLCPSPGELPDPGIKPRSVTLQVDSLPPEPSGKPLYKHTSPLFWLSFPFRSPQIP